jgi:LysR family glycine cleavage system transcriptional activator
MPRRLPNLNQLRAFEATARHLSFKDVASELFVTQAAISHQVKALEQEIGRQLFHRRGRDVSLT